MTPRPSPRVGATSPLVYWLALVSGLAALTVLRPDDLDAMGALWVGSVLGTAVGQLLAWKRLRLWLLVIAVIMSCWLALPIVAGFQVAQTLRFAEVGLLPLAAAAFCGYLSLSERGALASFWFPAVPWMLAMLQGGERAALRGGMSVFFLFCVAGLLLAFLRARETRRVALWEAHASARLTPNEEPIVLRASPLRAFAHVVWMTALGAAVIGITASVAPHLWARERLRGGVAAAVHGARPCCDDEDPARERVSEFVSLTDAHPVEPRRASCTQCRHGVPIASSRAAVATAPTTTTSGATNDADPTRADPSVPDAPWSREATRQGPAGRPDARLTPRDDVVPAPQQVAAAAPSSVVPPKAAPVAPPTPPTVAAPPAAARPAAAPPVAPPHVASRPASTPAFIDASADDARPSRAVGNGSAPLPGGGSLGWLLASIAAVAAGALALHLGLRPLRRWLTLRHLRRPIWTETVDQRVSNLWQLVLVGLHDAGFRVAPGEQPHDLARRVGLEGMTICASVLERARHGVRVDGADLEAMTAAAESVYAAARARAGLLARAAGAVRWPLA